MSLHHQNFLLFDANQAPQPAILGRFGPVGSNDDLASLSAVQHAHMMAPAPTAAPAPLIFATNVNGATMIAMNPGTPNAQPVGSIAIMAPAQATNDDDDEGVPFGTPSCLHNNWDNVRVKKSIVTLSCRDCHKKWKQTHPIPNLCPDFYQRVCPFGPHCPYLHVHRFKSRAKSPNPPCYIEGTTRDPLFYQCAKDVLERCPPNTTPTAAYDDVITLFAQRQQQQQQQPAQVPQPQTQQQQQQQQQSVQAGGQHVVYRLAPATEVLTSVQPAVRVVHPVQGQAAMVSTMPQGHANHQPAQAAGWFALPSPFAWFDRRNLK